jgi:hypothetical protein
VYDPGVFTLCVAVGLAEVKSTVPSLLKSQAYCVITDGAATDDPLPSNVKLDPGQIVLSPLIEAVGEGLNNTCTAVRGLVQPLFTA